MKKSTFLIFIAYIWTKTLLGLTVSPFHSVREVVRKPILTPVIFSPIIGLLILFLVGRIAAVLIVVYGLKREIIAIFLSTTLFSILFWQILLLYLLGSFFVASRRK
jgi:hypothetical protein